MHKLLFQSSTLVSVTARHFTRSARPSARSVSTTADRMQGARSGSVVAWGRIDEGRLGMRFPDSEFTVADLARPGGPAVGPTHLSALEGAVAVVARASKSLALLSDGSVWSWGTCENMSLGHGEGVKRLTAPKRVEALKNIKIVHVRPH